MNLVPVFCSIAKKRRSIIFLLVAGLIAACAPMGATLGPVSPSTTTGAAHNSKTITVLAAASLSEAFNEIGKLFEAQNAGIKVLISYAGSQQLAQQLNQGVEADVFASASMTYMDVAVEAKRVNKADVKIFAQNRLVVIYPRNNPAGIKQLSDLTRPGLKLDLADKAVPVGQYSLDFLDKASKDPRFDPQYTQNVLKNVVSFEDNVKAVLNKVALDEVDAGIVYQTDITPAAALKVATLEIPDALNTIATYPIAPIADSQNAFLARAFANLALSPEGQAVLVKYGFILPAK